MKGDFLSDLIWVTGLGVWIVLAAVGLFFALVGALRIAIEHLERPHLDAEIIPLFDRELHSA